MPVKMANGLDRLEKLFTGSRKKDKIILENKILEPRNMVFPSPSFLRPTSINMTPRDARGEDRGDPCEDRGRSHSLPGPNLDARWRSSEYTSTKQSNCHQTRNHAIRALPSTVEHNYDPSVAPKLSEFRFPENVLFMHDEFLRISKNPSPPAMSLECSSRQNKPNETQCTNNNNKSLDDPLTRRSAQLSPHLRSSSDVYHGGGRFAESRKLLPSPIITRSNTVKPRRQASIRSSLTTPSPAASPRQALEPKFTLFPKQRPTLPFHEPGIVSPPASDNGEDQLTSPIKRTMSTISLPTPDSSAASSLGSPKPYWALGEAEHRHIRTDTWETWGYRQDDLTRGGNVVKANDGSLQLRSLRKSASAATLPVAISRISNERALREPTLVDFYDLSDDDIAESQAPAPPPKDTPPSKVAMPPSEDTASSKICLQDFPVRTSCPVTSVNPSTGDITPPSTPTNSQLINLEYGSYGMEGARGAIWCARIARKYHFDMLYVVSVWPNAARNHWDPSIRPLAESPNAEAASSVPHGCAHALHSKPMMAGRLLAGFGLDKMATPFQISSDVHLKQLRSNDWVEYLNQTDDMDDLSYGWAHSFHNDYVPVMGSPDHLDILSRDRGPNRGIIFAAYANGNNNATISSCNSTEKEALFDKLLSDCSTLVDALIDWT